MATHPLLELAGFFFGIGLYLYLFSALFRLKRKNRLEYLLLGLLGALLLWYSGNFAALLLREIPGERAAFLLSLSEAVAFGGLGLVPALLLHTHWTFFRRSQAASQAEKWIFRISLAAVWAMPAVFPWALPELFSGPHADPFIKLGRYTLPFIILLSVSYYLSAFLQWRISRHTSLAVEQRLFRRLLPIFIAVPVFNLFVFPWGGGQSGFWGPYLVSVAKLSSLLPTLVVAYYIHSYQFLHIAVSRSLSLALLVLVTLTAYLAGVRSLSEYLEDELGGSSLLLEGVFLALILLLFPTVSDWLERQLGTLMGRRLRRYRRLAEHLQQTAPSLATPGQLAEHIEEQLRQRLPVSSVAIHLGEEQPPNSIGGVYPLTSGGLSLGYLEVHLPQAEGSGADREALGMLAGEIASLLERASLLESQLQMERELSRKSRMEDLGRMAATVAHNVKNPLSSMKTLMQLWGESSNLTQEQRRELRMMIGEVDHLSETVTNLLQFSRLDQPRPGSGDAVRLKDLVGQTCSVFRGALEAQGLEFEMTFKPQDMEVQVDTRMLRDVLSNLISNSIEACSTGDRIEVEAFLGEDGWTIEVRDSGKGIPVHLREQLFEPFVTDKSKGTGLGLAIVRSKVEQLGGSIELLDTGQGTCFRLTFPEAE